MRKRYAFLLTAVLFFFSFPPFCYTAFLAYFVLIPFLFLIEKMSFRASFRKGYALGFLTIGGFMYWLNWNTGANLFQATGMYLGSVFYLALYWGIFSTTQVWAFQKMGRKSFWLVPFTWTALDYAQSLSELGFTWHSLATTQTYYTPLIQFVEFTGMYGLTFMIVMANVLIYFLLCEYRESKIDRMKIVYLLVLLIVPLVHGIFVLSREEKVKTSFSVSIIQPNIEPNKKWLVRDWAFDELIRMTQEAPNSDLIVWPETALPVRLRVDKFRMDSIRNVLIRKKSSLLTGVPDRKTVEDTNGNTNSHYYNSVFLIRPDNKNLDSYDKVHLVPFGEFVPNFLFFLKGIAMEVGASDYYPGDQVEVFNVPVKKDSIKIMPVICLESIYPQLFLEGVRKGAECAAIVTNDAWYDGTPGPEQHARIAVLRAIENRIAIVRCANSGVSGIIDSRGVFTDYGPNGERLIINGLVNIVAEETLFKRWGFWFPGICFVVVFASIGILFFKKRTL